MATFRKWFDLAESWLRNTAGLVLVFGWLFGMSAAFLGFTTAGCHLLYDRADWVMSMDWLTTGLASAAWLFAKVGFALLAGQYCLVLGDMGFKALFCRSAS